MIDPCFFPLDWSLVDDTFQLHSLSERWLLLLELQTHLDFPDNEHNSKYASLSIVIFYCLSEIQ